MISLGRWRLPAALGVFVHDGDSRPARCSRYFFLYLSFAYPGRSTERPIAWGAASYLQASAHPADHTRVLLRLPCTPSRFASCRHRHGDAANVHAAGNSDRVGLIAMESAKHGFPLWVGRDRDINTAQYTALTSHPLQLSMFLNRWKRRRRWSAPLLLYASGAWSCPLRSRCNRQLDDRIHFLPETSALPCWSTRRDKTATMHLHPDGQWRAQPHFSSVRNPGGRHLGLALAGLSLLFRAATNRR